MRKARQALLDGGPDIQSSSTFPFHQVMSLVRSHSAKVLSKSMEDSMAVKMRPAMLADLSATRRTDPPRRTLAAPTVRTCG